MPGKKQSNLKAPETGPHREIEVLCQTHIEIPVGDIIFHIFGVAHNKKFEGWSKLDDRHEHHELMYTMRGRGTYELNGKKVLAKEGDFFFIPRGVVHHGRIAAGVQVWESLMVQLDFSLARDPDIYLDDLGVFPMVLPFYRHFIVESEFTLEVSPEMRPQFELVVQRLALEVASHTFDYDVILQSQMLEFLALVCRAAREQVPDLPLRHYASRATSLLRLEKARQFIKQNYAESLSLKQVAAEACISPYRFVRLFRDAFGVSPMQYQASMRISEAKRLLVNTTMQVSEISDRLGYSSPEYFSRRFSAKVGVSPSKYTQHVVGQLDERSRTE